MHVCVRLICLLLNNIDYKMRQWAKGEGGKKFKAYFGERYTMKIDIPDVGG